MSRGCARGSKRQKITNKNQYGSEVVRYIYLTSLAGGLIIFSYSSGWESQSVQIQQNMGTLRAGCEYHIE